MIGDILARVGRVGIFLVRVLRHAGVVLGRGSARRSKNRKGTTTKCRGRNGHVAQPRRPSASKSTLTAPRLA